MARNGMAHQLTVRDVAIRFGWTYPRAYNAALSGRFGQPELVGRRIFVRAEAVERAARENER